MNVPGPNPPAWEEWQLTAFVLGELDEPLARQIQAAAERDASLSAEIASIYKAIDLVSQTYAAEAGASKLDAATGETRLAHILQRADEWQPGPRSRSQAGARRVWVGLLALSAAILVVVGLAGPRISQWRLMSQRPAIPTASSNPGTSIAQPLARPRGPTNNSAGQPLAESLQGSGQVLAYDAWQRESEEVAESYYAQSPAGLASGPGDKQPASFTLGIEEDESLESRLADAGSGPTGGPAAEFSSPAGGYGGMMGGYGIAGKPSQGMASAPAGMDGEIMGGGMMGGPGAAPVELRDPAYAYSLNLPASGMDGVRGLASESLAPESSERNWREFRFRSELQRTAEASSNRFESIVENKFQRVEDAPLSTFSIDVDSASYTKVRQLLMEANQLPPADAVRIEEFINYFDYEYAGPAGDEPFAAKLAVAGCPWRPEHKLVRIALQALKMEVEQRPAANIVFLLDVSGSMNEPNKLPLVKESMRMLIEQLGENDRIAMVVYAGAAGCVLESTRGDKQTEILAALDRLQAGGSTNGGDGIQLAYNLARDHYIPGGINRVILCTDGDFNVGVTSTQALVDLVVENAQSKTFLTVLGYGNGNTNDAMMEKISNQGNGVYAFVDSWREAKRQMVQQLAGNLITVAKDVKIQVEFNPGQISAYRLLGYENRIMAAEDFNNDKKDAGEVGAGHRVTALYEVVPVGVQSNAGQSAVDDLRYQPKPPQPEPTVIKAAGDAQEFNNELLAVKLRYKQPEGDTSQLLVFPLKDADTRFEQADSDFRWAASVAQFGMLLRGSQYSGNSTWSSLIQQATATAGSDPDAQREECLQMLRRAAQLSAAGRPVPPYPQYPR